MINFLISYNRSHCSETDVPVTVMHSAPPGLFIPELFALSHMHTVYHAKAHLSHTVIRLLVMKYLIKLTLILSALEELSVSALF